MLEFLERLERLTNKRPKINFSHWRPSDQKVYISDISKIREKLNWQPKISIEEGIRNIIRWVNENREYFI